MVYRSQHSDTFPMSLSSFCFFVFVCFLFLVGVRGGFWLWKDIWDVNAQGMGFGGGGGGGGV